ncbi:Trehalose-phosphate synthase [Legionella wadsworthii]|uniref:Trehalose-phosphate synthase n=1 Tax=Legionella wadsworthii TaxID=28088 RepID=A0A378LV01_9GAMM|nr:bifunctional alpha,alpha-trehalose-phosphate synthase (UDP-forming)/trehalose-phosphatase [Legionella wadsworthii]STY29648.1 Trehalose-phosphate synthase [Legionella wadsworthii]
MRLIIISNRLPITIIKDKSQIYFQQSIGGLATGLNTFLEEFSAVETVEWLWVGWPGSHSDNIIKDIHIHELQKQNLFPIIFPEKTMDKFYQGFCNKTLWPLFHYFTEFATYDEENWHTYKAVNEAFANKLTTLIRPDDILWINDYHLLLLPSLLNAGFPNIPIGFFFHTPFPAYEVFQLIPKNWRSELLKGLLGADLIGFHTSEYAQNFLHSVSLNLGYEHNMGVITTKDKLIKTKVFPMGIAFNKIQHIAGSSKTQNKKEELQKSLQKTKIILSVDRLDYTKGIINRLQAYELFLEKNENWHKKATLVLIVAPSRDSVSHYQSMKKKIEECVSHINGKYGDIDWMPILYQYKNIEFEDLIALYGISDAILVTPIRDGMNLIAKEYIASRIDKKGVLILSETAGAAKELSESFIVNPNSIEEIASAIKMSLSLNEQEQILRNHLMQRRLKNYDVICWGNEFIDELVQTKEQNEIFSAKTLQLHDKQKFIEHYHRASKRLILLDYDGTLVPYTIHPQEAKPDTGLLDTLFSLTADPRNNVVIISGRDKDTLNQWFYSLPIHMIGEHGACIKEIGKQWDILTQKKCDWKESILSLLNKYADRLPGAFIEEKEFSLAWHYRNTLPEQSLYIVKELTDDLVHFVAHGDLQVLWGNKVIELRHANLNKGNATLYFILKSHYDFIMAIGDDVTDEDMFKVLPETAYSIKVGIGASHAKYHLKNHNQVVDLLNLLSQRVNLT